MLDNITDFITASLQQESTETISERIESTNSTNSSERHLLEYEDGMSETLSKIGLDYSFTLLINSTTTWLIFNQLKFITPDFSGIFFHLFIVAVSLLMNLPYLTTDNVNRKYLISLTLGRLILGFVVNGRIISTIDSRIEVSKTAYTELKEEVRSYEEPKQTRNDTPIWLRTDLILPGLLVLLFFISLSGLFKTKRQEQNNG